MTADALPIEDHDLGDERVIEIAAARLLYDGVDPYTPIRWHQHGQPLAVQIMPLRLWAGRVALELAGMVER